MAKCKHGQEINDGHWTEMIDRIHVVKMNVREHLLDHPVSCAHEDIKIELTKAADALMNAYELAGRKAP